MSNHTIETIDDRFEADALKIPFVVKDGDSDNDRQSLSGATISWELREDQFSDPVLTDDDSSVSLTVTDEANGEFEVFIDTGATEDLFGRNKQVVIIEDSNGNRSTSMGDVRLTEIKR